MRRTDLRHLLDRRQAIEPRHQRILQGGRDRHRRQRPGQGVAAVAFDQEPDSSTVLVSSSTNSGTPSVRAMI